MRRFFRRINPQEMGTGPILPTMLTIGLPAAAGGIFQSLFEMTDTLFISWLGKDAISGVSLVGPLLFCTFAIAQAINVGIAALVSRYLGARRDEDARQILNHGLILATVTGIILTIVLLLTLDPILRAMGATGEIEKSARGFSQIIFISILFMQIGTAADGALRAQGDTITPMQVGMIANIVNAILNPVLIFGLHMGVQGSATATLITRSIMALVLLSRLWSPQSTVKPGGFAGIPWAERMNIIGKIYWVGIPASVGLFAMAISMVFINKILVDINPYALGVLGIAGRIEMFATVPIFGLFSAVVPMVGFNLGAHHFNRIRQTVWTATWLGAAIMGAGGLIIWLFPTVIFGIFTKDPEMLPMGVQYLRIMMPVYPLIGASILTSAGFQGLGMSWIAMLMHIWRNLLTKLPFAYYFAAIWGLVGVWWSFPASTLASAGLTFIWMWWVLRDLEIKITKKQAQEMKILEEESA